MNLKSDVFCSGAIVLPDKGARILNVGGWSLDSTFGVRMYTPDGVLGTNSSNDWEENEATLHLQVGVALILRARVLKASFLYRADVGIRLHQFCPMVAFS